MVGAADRVLSNSPYGARRIWKAYRRRATVIEHGVDFPHVDGQTVADLRAKYGLENRRVAVTVNHLHPRKRIDLFLRAVNVARQATDVVALVVGQGPEEGALKRLAADLGMEVGKDVVFTGMVPEQTLPAHYALGDVYVHTGLQESFGLSVIEALYLGLPVVTVNEGGPCDTVQHGVSGYLVRPTAEALGAAIAGLMNDPTRAREMGHAGAEFVRKHFSWEQGVVTLLKAIDGDGA
jgi:phosphatidylinositol alpha-1,6-mannosyltransferase